MSTLIGWADETWNPIRARNAWGERGWHCERVSEGCKHCYAEHTNVTQRFEGTGRAYNRRSREMVRVYLDETTLLQPLHWRKPRRVFVESMSDLYGEWVPDEWLDKIKAVEALCPQHTFIELTKRPERMREYLIRLDRSRVHEAVGRDFGDEAAVRAANWINGWSQPRNAPDDGNPLDGTVPRWPLPNVWGLTSIEDQKTADLRVPELLETPLAVRGVSLEPQLESVDLTNLDYNAFLRSYGLVGEPHEHDAMLRYDVLTGHMKGPDDIGLPKLDWVIQGGESGKGARPWNAQWGDDMREACKAAGVPYFMKQMGRRPFNSVCPDCGRDPRKAGSCRPPEIKLKSKHGADPSEWPERFRVQEFPR